MKRYIKCKRLNKTIEIFPEAIPNLTYGWICDCGQWTKEEPDNHIVYGGVE